MKMTVLDIPDKLSLEEFINLDEFLPTGDTLTTSDIVALVLNENKEDNILNNGFFFIR